MRAFRFASCLILAALTGLAAGQTAPQNPSSTTPATARKKARKSTAPRAGVAVLPLETAPPTPPAAPGADAQQKAADQRLLQQQQAQSDKAAQINNEQVQQAQKQKEKIDGEVRIQDAPGPAQTGVVPAAGAPVPSANANVGIQDAPGPAQTVPAPSSITPSQLPGVPTTSTPK